MVYAPKKFAGKHAQDIISLVIHANRTVSKKLVRVLDNIKNEQYVTTISGDVPWRDYQEDISEDDLDTFAADSTLAFADATVKPEKIMAMDKFAMDDLRSSRFAEDMKAGAANITSNEFEQAVISYLTPKLGKSYEKRYYLGITAAIKTAIAASSAPAAQKAWAAAQTAGKTCGVVARLIYAGIVDAAATVINVVGTTVTAANIVAEYKKIHLALPTEVAGKSTLFVPEGDFALILQANDDQTVRDKFTVSGDDMETATVKYLGMKIEFVPITGMRFAGIAGDQGDFILGTDLLADSNEFTIGEKNNLGDVKFGKAVASLDAHVLLPQQKVLYI